jgi:hypothetical protein
MEFFQPVLLLIFNDSKDLLRRCDIIVFRYIAGCLVNWKGLFKFV